MTQPEATSPISYEEALEIVRRELPTPGPHSQLEPADLIVFPEHTQEFPWGWIVYYGHRLGHTGDLKYLLGGNAPYFVNRADGSWRTCGTARPATDYVKEHVARLRFGDPPELTPCDVQSNVDLRTVLEVFRSALQLSLLESKRLADEIREGGRPRLRAETLAQAEELAEVLDLEQS